MDRIRGLKAKPDYTSIELLSHDAPSAVDPPGTLVKVREPTLGFRRRFLPSLAVLFTTGCAAALWSLRLSDWKDSLGFYSFVVNHRVAIQVFIHILSSVLTLLWIYGVCSTINLITRHLFARKAVSIKTLRVWTLISQARLSFSIPFSSFLICAAFCLITFLPAWLWTGALTPQTTFYNVTGNGTFPKTGNNAYPFLNLRLPDDNVDFECRTTTQANGTFTSCPGLYQSGSLLASAGSATTIDGGSRNHSKIGDTTAFQYSGRSYGAGSSVGLTIYPPNITTLYGYSYTELGYLTTAKCVYNDASQWEIHEHSCPDDNTYPCYYLARGCFPNSHLLSNGSCDPSHTDFYAQLSLDLGAASIVAMGATNSDNLTDYYLAIAATQMWSQLDKIQCQFFFKPTWFEVNVSTIDTRISVTPIGDGSDPEPRGMLRSKVLDALNVISMVQTTIYTSTVGESLHSNIRNYVYALTDGTGKAGNGTAAQVLAAVTDSMEAMVDDILQSFAAYSLTQTGAFEKQEVLFMAGGVEIGEYPFIIATLIFQFLALIGVVAALIFSKFWSRTPAFDYSDIGTISAAAHLGANPHNIGLWSSVRHWKGEPDDSSLNVLSARYKHSQPHEPPVILIVPTEGYESERGSMMFRPNSNIM